MSVSLPNGSTIHIASGTGAAINVTGISNAVQAVCTAAAHGLTNGDFVILTSGWSRLTDKVFRVAGSTTNTFELEGQDTSDTNIYPAGGGIGSVKKISGWTQLTQVLETQSQGGEQQFASYQFLEGDREVRIPTSKSGGGININVADDPTLPGYILASKANDDRVERAVRITTSKGSKILFLSYITLDKTPTMNVNNVMACQATLSHLNEPVRYAA